MKKTRFLPLMMIGAVLTLVRPLYSKAISPTTSLDTSMSETRCDAIHAYLLGQMHRLKIPGISLTIVEGDQIIHQHGFGRARPGGEAPTSQTPFLIGSTAKSITASAVMQLVEAGKVELDAPIQRYLPWFKVKDPAASARITVRHLLNQTSGFPGIPGMAILANLDNRPDACLRQAQALASIELSNPVGTTFEYSNLNYNLLGLIIEAASGKTYPDYIQEHIFEPLEMKHSYTDLASAQKDNLAVGHRYWFGIPIPIRNLPLARGSLPSGQLISTAEDLSHYLIAHINNGYFGDAQILSSASIEEMQHSAAEQLVMGKPITSYGMGWFINEIDGVKIIAHGGNVPDFSAYMALIPEQNKGVVILANSDQWGLPFVLMEVGDGVAALLAGKQPPSIKLGFLPWLMRALPLLPLFQVGRIYATLIRLRNWRNNPALRPNAALAVTRDILPALVPNLSLAAILDYLRTSGLLGFMRLYMPDLALIARVSGGLAGIWAIVRTVLILRLVRKSS